MIVAPTTRRVFRGRLPVALTVALAGMILYLLIGAAITPFIQYLYHNKPDVVFAPSHFNDARQYVFICTQGYHVPFDVLPTLQVSRINWMPVYAWLQCAVNHLTGLSMIYTGVAVSTLAIGVTLFLGTLTLRNLGVRLPGFYALAALIPPIGGAWLYLPGVEATYLAVGMAVMWLLTLPVSDGHEINELLRFLAGLSAGIVFILTKPNALAMLLPLAFAFFYLSWQRSRAAGYTSGLWTFVADVIIDHLPARSEPRPIRYHWTAAGVAAGIILGFTLWLAYTSQMSGIPFYFMQQQLNVWGRAWPGGNVGEMLTYFAQAFHNATGLTPWRYNAAWNLAANLSALVPAASPRVPALIRGMLPLMVMFILYSGAIHGSDRYILSTALVAVGWGCWLAPGPQCDARNSGGKRKLRWVVLRWTFLALMALITSWLLVNEMLPRQEPRSWGVVDD